MMFCTIYDMNIKADKGKYIIVANFICQSISSSNSKGTDVTEDAIESS